MTVATSRPAVDVLSGTEVRQRDVGGSKADKSKVFGLVNDQRLGVDWHSHIR